MLRSGMDKNPEIDVYKKLPERYAIKDSGDHLYEIGITSQSVNHNEEEEPKKHRDFRYFTILVYVIFIVKCLIIIASINSREYEFFFIVIGDFTYYIPSVRIHFNV